MFPSISSRPIQSIGCNVRWCVGRLSPTIAFQKIFFLFPRPANSVSIVAWMVQSSHRILFQAATCYYKIQANIKWLKWPFLDIPGVLSQAPLSLSLPACSTEDRDRDRDRDTPASHQHRPPLQKYYSSISALWVDNTVKVNGFQVKIFKNQQKLC